jgi:hypothetical protein
MALSSGRVIPPGITLTPNSWQRNQLRGAFLSWVMAPAAVPTDDSANCLDGVHDQQFHRLIAGARHHGVQIRVGDY